MIAPTTDNVKKVRNVYSECKHDNGFVKLIKHKDDKHGQWACARCHVLWRDLLAAYFPEGL